MASAPQFGSRVMLTRLRAAWLSKELCSHVRDDIDGLRSRTCMRHPDAHKTPAVLNPSPSTAASVIQSKASRKCTATIVQSSLLLLSKVAPSAVLVESAGAGDAACGDGAIADDCVAADERVVADDGVASDDGIPVDDGVSADVSSAEDPHGVAAAVLADSGKVVASLALGSRTLTSCVSDRLVSGMGALQRPTRAAPISSMQSSAAVVAGCRDTSVAPCANSLLPLAATCGWAADVLLVELIPRSGIADA